MAETTKFECECGSIINVSGIRRHNQTKKHKTFDFEGFRRMLELTKHIPIGENTIVEKQEIVKKQEIVEKQEINENQKDEKKSDVKLFYISSDEIRAGLWKNLNPKSAKTGEGLIDWLKREKREREAPPAPPAQTAPPAVSALPATAAPP